MKSFLLFAVLLCLLFPGFAFATDYVFGPGDEFGVLSLFDYDTFLMTGGGGHDLGLGGWSTGVIHDTDMLVGPYEGGIWELETYSYAELIVNGGEFYEVGAHGESLIHFHGGQIFGSLTVFNPTAWVHLYGYGFNNDPFLGSPLTGFWADDTPFSINLVDSSYSTFDQIVFHEVYETEPLTGKGTQEEPYLILSLANFDEFAVNNIYWASGVYIRLDCDPDLIDRTYTTAIIAPDTDNSNYYEFDGIAFAGNFDGNGHKIVNLTIDTSGFSNDYLGLFGKIGSLAEVKSLGVENCNIVGGYFSSYLGGLVGENHEGDIINCYATGNVAGGNDSSYVGGLAGMNNGGNINNCYATSNATGGNSPGGLVGNNKGGGDIKNCYSMGRVTGFGDFGGFVGDNNQGHIINCFWDMETSEKTLSDGGFGRSTTQMKESATYIGWGDGLWTIDEGNDYPHLVWENAGGTLIDNILERSYSGTGLNTDPFIITAAEDMYCMTIRQQDWSGYFKLANNIDMTGITYLPPYDFTGKFNGNGYEINNLRINEPGSPLLGLFGCISSGSEIYNLDIIDVVVTGSYFIGGLVGKNNNGNISNCYVSGSVSGNGGFGGLVGWSIYGSISDCHTIGTVTSGNDSNMNHGGGLVGGNYKGVISNCNATVSVNGGRWSHFFGGLVGHNDGGNISKCYAVGNVNCGSSSYAIGGLIGMNDEGIISDSYAMGSISGSGSYFAGLVGKNERGSISNCYATGRVTGGSLYGLGGLVGRNYKGNVYNSFWDTETSLVAISDGGTGLPTAQMQIQVTFTDAGWDFMGETVNGIEDIWFISQGDYPHLWWEGIEANLKITPQTLNCSSEGDWVKAHFTLPEGYTTEDVDTDRQMTIKTLSIASDHVDVSYNGEGLVEIEAAFVRSELCGLGLYGDSEFTASGWFADGTGFHGTDMIRITTNKLEKLPEFLSYWLDTDCSEPGWCGGYDIDGDGVVDLKDFAMLE